MNHAAIFWPLLLLLVAPHSVDRGHAGDWYVSDTTDNNTGERQVYAMQALITRENFVQLTMRCSQGQPAFFLEWQEVAFPNLAVVSIGAAKSPDSEVEEARYVFEKSRDDLERGLKASPETSRKIVAAIGAAPYAVITAHLPSGERTVGMAVSGTEQAWDRVTRHCPAPIMPVPPL